MKKEELRIGNFIMDSDTERVGHVIRLSEKKVSVKLEHSTLWQDIGEFEPIPLSEDLLLKCGFINDENAPWKLCNGMLVLNTGNHNTWEYGQSVIKDIKYLHTLQNVFFALHHRELEVSI